MLGGFSFFCAADGGVVNEIYDVGGFLILSPQVCEHFHLLDGDGPVYCLLRSMSEVLPPQIPRHFVTTVMIASDWLTLEIVDRSTCCLKRTQKAKLLVKQ